MIFECSRYHTNWTERHKNIYVYKNEKWGANSKGAPCVMHSWYNKGWKWKFWHSVIVDTCVTELVKYSCFTVLINCEKGKWIIVWVPLCFATKCHLLFLTSWGTIGCNCKRKHPFLCYIAVLCHTFSLLFIHISSMQCFKDYTQLQKESIHFVFWCWLCRNLIWLCAELQWAISLIFWVFARKQNAYFLLENGM